jgi:hypothetical protein
VESWLTDIWGAAQKAGPFATMLVLYIWYLERNDRLKLQGERDNLLERYIGALNNVNMTLELLRNTIGAAGESIKEALRRLQGSPP